VPVRRHSVSSKNGAERRAGPKHRLSSSLNLLQDGVPSSSCSCMYQCCVMPSRLYEAIHTCSSTIVRYCRKYDSHLLMKRRGSVLPSNRGKSHFWNLGGRSMSR